MASSTILIPSKTRSGITPQKTYSSSMTTDEPVKKRKLRKMILPYEIVEEEEEEEDETKVSLVMRTKAAEIGDQKVVEKAIQRGVQMIFSTLMDQVEKQLATSEAHLVEVTAGGEVLETAKVQVAKVVVGLKSAEGASKVEASGVPKYVVSEFAINLASEVVDEEKQAASDVMETDMTNNNLNSIFEDCFDYSKLNHISLTPSPKPSYKPSPKHISSLVHKSEPVMNSTNLTPII